MAFVKRVVFTSPSGTAEPYCYLKSPDYGKDDFKNERGVYKVSLTCDNDAPRTQAMINEIIKAHEEDYEARLEAHAANPPAVVKGKKPPEIAGRSPRITLPRESTIVGVMGRLSPDFLSR